MAKPRYPSEHLLSLNRVHQFIELIAHTPDIADDELIEQLIALGIPHFDAELLLAFVPSVFAWPLLQRLEIDSFPSTFIISDKSGKDFEYLLSQQHYFLCALSIANEIFEEGYTSEISKAVVMAVTERSAELDAANSALFEKGSIKGVTLQPTRFNRFYAEDFLSHQIYD